MPDQAAEVDAGKLAQAVQSGLDTATRKLGTLGEIVTESIQAGGHRETRGRLGLPHLEDAMAVLGVITRNSKGRDPDELSEEVRVVDRCLRRAAVAMSIDYDQL